MADRLTLDILTPQKRVLTTETPWVTVPGSQGELGILPEHVPLVTTVDSGILQFEENGKKRKAAVHYGYAQVHGDTVTVLTDMVEVGEAIDMERARKAEQNAREHLRTLTAEQAAERDRLDKAEAKLRRALVRQQAGE